MWKWFFGEVPGVTRAVTQPEADGKYRGWSEFVIEMGNLKKYGVDPSNLVSVTEHKQYKAAVNYYEKEKREDVEKILRQ